MGKGPAVLCLHGFPDSPATFRSLLPRLADAGFRGIAPVLRGYEPSSQPADGDYGIRALVDDV
ncbi:MAG: alpha/beta fold hydrolase [Alphaproteobacteria bacterium]|nr:alpha/beta fold hydrolase [Alphaproteobacteria bacterium]